jgi:hypothetical protein
MLKSRANIFDEAEPPEIDVSSFAPKKASDPNAPPANQVKAVSLAAQFRSREPEPEKEQPQPARAPRVHRTGRNVQFNVKASRETIEAIYAITDAHPGWVARRHARTRYSGFAARAGIHAMSRTRFYNAQFDLFLATIVDLRFRDQKDTMERPFFSLSKQKRMKPIEYRNENDGIFVTVQPRHDYGMATIWDAEILIWAAAVLCDMKNRDTNDIPRELKFQPHDLLARYLPGKRRKRLRAAARFHGTAQNYRGDDEHPCKACPEDDDVQLD